MARALPLRRGTLARYGILVGLPLLGVVLVLKLGSGLVSAGLPNPAATARPPGAWINVLLLLTQLFVIILVARVAGRAMAAVGQPRVVGEMAAGLVLGPSVLGALWPAAWAALFPIGTVRFLIALSQIGLLFFMFLVGLSLDSRRLRERGETALLTSHVSIAMPFLLGTALALLLYPHVGPAGVRFRDFALFVGAAMSVTAFPVLARMVDEHGLTGTPLGVLALACAAVDDVTAWCILAAIVVLVRQGSDTVPLWVTLGGGGAYVLLMVFGVRTLLRRLARDFARRGAISQDAIAVVVLTVLASAWATERLGVHAVFGAFLAGVVMPRDAALRREMVQRFEDVMVVLLLPLFFVVTGVNTRIALIGGAGAWALFGAVVLVAVAGKLGGSAVAARVTGATWREALALGALMNTRGLMELVILNVGLDIGIVSSELFAMMVLMALVTTLMTTPLLKRILGSAGLDDALPLSGDRGPVAM